MRILLPMVPADKQLPLARQWWLFTLMSYVAQGRPEIKLSRIDDFDPSGKGWKHATHLALTSAHAHDAHYVKGTSSACLIRIDLKSFG